MGLIIEERQLRVITQTLTRPSTTITTLVTLGLSGNADFATPTPELPPPPPPPAAPSAQTNPTSSVLTNEQLGAILGSVLGFLVIVVPLCYCCFRRDPDWRRRRPHWSSSDSGSTYSGSSHGGRRPPHPEPWRRMHPGPPVREPFQPVLVPPPARIPPRRYAPYRQTAQPQFRSGVQISPWARR